VVKGRLEKRGLKNWGIINTLNTSGGGGETTHGFGKDYGREPEEDR